MAAGWEPILACEKRPPVPPTDVALFEIPGLSQRFEARTYGALDRLIGDVKPDLIQVHNLGAPRLITLLSRRLPTVASVHVHGPYCPGGSKVFWRTGRLCPRPLGVGCLVHAYTQQCASRRPLRLWRQFAYSREAITALHHARRVLALSRYVRDLLIKSGLEPNRVLLATPWVEIPAEVPPLGMGGGRILYAGRINRGKGLDLLLQALAQVRKPFRLVVVGDGPERVNSERLVDELGLGAVVEFRGWLDRKAMARCYAECSMLVFPSTVPETFGLVGPEAMAYGKPVIAFDTGAVREWLSDDVTGIVVSRGDVRGLAMAIDRLLLDNQLLVRLGRAARNHTVERFSAMVGVSRLIRCYEESLAA